MARGVRTSLLAAACSAVALAKTVPVTNVTITTRACQPPYDAFPFCNASLPLDARINDLIGRLEDADIPGLITARHYTPTTCNNISRLGIPEYDWGMNAIHGVQSACVQTTDGTVKCPTSWPNPVNYGMMWNKTAFYTLGRYIGLEARALWLAGATEENAGKGQIPPHIGLDAWSPNINIARDPRWGRNQEVPSEDPLINGDFGAQHTMGLQTPADGDPRYLQVIVTLKHWDAYSLENSDNFTRYDFNAIVSNYSLADTYFPAFKKSVVQGGAQGVMCSYNALNGVPTCASAFLSSVLRGEWGFDGYITSDSGALENIYQNHNYAPDAQHAACVAIRDGQTDVCSGQVYNTSLLPAVAAGLCSRDDVNRALYHTFSVRMKLGLFDPVENQPYWHLDTTNIGTPAAVDNSLQSTLEGQVLLKNNGNTLPFTAGKKIAVIGPHANATAALVGNYLGQLCPDDTFDCITSPFQAISAINNAAGGSTISALGCTITANDTSGIAPAVALAQQSDIVVLMLGIDGTVENEMRDRTSIDLPGVQHQLAAAVAAVGKPTVVVLVHGGSLDVTPERDSAAIGAMLEVGYPGFFGSSGIAATLFGNNPYLGGKLAYTVYPASYVNLINMSEMELDVGPGRGYRYYTGTPVFPFGYGLAYTTFTMNNAVSVHASAATGSAKAGLSTGSPVTNYELIAKAPSQGLRPAVTLSYIPTSDALATSTASTRRSNTNGPSGASGYPTKRLLSYAVNVTNTGSVAGDEVVQAYFMPLSTPQQPRLRLIRQLFDYQRVHLEPGQTVTVTFQASADSFLVVDKATGDRVATPGVYDVVITDGTHTEKDIIHRVVLTGPQALVEPFPGSGRQAGMM